MNSCSARATLFAAGPDQLRKIFILAPSDFNPVRPTRHTDSLQIWENLTVAKESDLVSMSEHERGTVNV